MNRNITKLWSKFGFQWLKSNVDSYKTRCLASNSLHRKLRWIESAHDPSPKSWPVYFPTLKYLKCLGFNEKRLAFRVFKQKSCIIVNLRFILTEIQGSSSGITLQSPLYLLRVNLSKWKKLLRNIVFYFSAFRGSLVWLSPLQSSRNSYRMLSVSEIVKISDSKHQLALNSPRKLTADLGCFRKTTAKVILKNSMHQWAQFDFRNWADSNNFVGETVKYKENEYVIGTFCLCFSTAYQH